METIGQRIKQVREELRLSQAELVRRLGKRFPAAGITQQSLSELERGDTQTTGFAVEIAIVLGVNPLWLATGEGDRDAIQVEALDPITAKAVRVMQTLPDYKKSHAAAIIDTFAQPDDDGGQKPTDQEAAKAAGADKRRRRRS